MLNFYTKKNLKKSYENIFYKNIKIRVEQLKKTYGIKLDKKTYKIKLDRVSNISK